MGHSVNHVNTRKSHTTLCRACASIHDTRVPLGYWWYGFKGLNSNLYAAPVYTKITLPEDNGDFWYCQHLEPVSPAMVQYFSQEFSPSRDLFQTLVADVAVFKPEIDYKVDPDLIEDVQLRCNASCFLFSF